MGPANNKQQLYLRRTLVRLNFFRQEMLYKSQLPCQI
jgi:hypothetical protein